jgi:DNA recombination protein RmuC
VADLEQMLLLFGSLILSALLAVVYLLLQQYKRNSTSGNNTDSITLQMLLPLLTDLRHQISANDQMGRTEIQGRLDHIANQIGQHQQQNTQTLLHQQQTHQHLLKDLGTQLGELHQANERIVLLANQMQSLERILQNPKQRGILGEHILSQVLTQVLPPQQFVLQYRFGSGKIVDAALFIRGQIVPIDAKFPLEKYTALHQTTDSNQRLALDKAFRADVRRRIDETAAYIDPAENTLPLALMFVPAEGVYYYILQAHNNASDDLLTYAWQKRVVMVSPASFYAYLETILHGLNALQIEQSAREVLQKLGDLQRRLKLYEEHADKAGKQLQNAWQAWQNAQTEWRRIDTQLLRLNQQTEAKWGNNGNNNNQDAQSKLFNTDQE